MSFISNVEQWSRDNFEENTLARLADALDCIWNHERRRLYPKPKNEPLDDNLATPPTEIPVVVEWGDLSIAASHWVTLDEVGSLVGQTMMAEAVRVGIFRVRVRGDCLSPKWVDGDLVEFELLRDELDFEVNRDYYVQTADGATFKRCFAQDENEITIGCLDGSAEWTIERRNILRAAVARGVLLVRPG